MHHRIFVCVLSLLVVACVAQKKGDPPPPTTAPAMLDGAWAMEVTIPEGETSPGSFTGTLVLAQEGTSLKGRVDDWSNGARSTFTGSIEAGRVRLDRLDGEPFAGFRTTFEGMVAQDGTMQGTFQNDASAPHGNSAAGTWRAGRK